MSEIEKRFNAILEVEPDQEDLMAIERIQKRNDKEKGATLEQMDLIRAERKYSGKVSLRLPRSLHKNLVQEAESEGISLNQFILYKLAR